jgi:hypothetical protein
MSNTEENYTIQQNALEHIVMCYEAVFLFAYSLVLGGVYVCTYSCVILF